MSAGTIINGNYKLDKNPVANTYDYISATFIWRAFECRYFAFLQIKTIVSTMIRHYDIEWKDPSWQPKIDYSQIVATPPPSPVTIKRRTKPVAGAMF